MGYASRNNPTAISAKKGELPPKKKPVPKRQMEALMRKRIQDATGLPQLVGALGGEYFYV